MRWWKRSIPRASRRTADPAPDAASNGEEPGLDAPEVHAPHGGHTGHRWLDLLLGGVAMVVSCVSLYVAIHHGTTMEKLVAANSWPNLQFSADIVRGSPDYGDASVKLQITVENNGVGPARLESLQIWNGATPIGDVDALGKALKATGDGAPLRVGLEGSTAVGQVIGAKSSLHVVGVTASDGAAWRLLFTRVGASLKARLCYCSVFDECYVVDGRQPRARPAKAATCPAVENPYQDDVSSFVLDGTSPRRGP